MAVYVDDPIHPYGRMRMCHMMADTREELLAMADAIGVARRWIQKVGTPYEHFDICKSKRAKAVSLGAKEVTTRDQVALIKARKAALQPVATDNTP